MKYAVQLVSLINTHVGHFDNNRDQENRMSMVENLSNGYEIISAIPYTNGQGSCGIEYILRKHIEEENSNE